MDRYISKCKSMLKFVACFSVLLGALFFVSPASAASREVNPNPIPNLKAVQVAWWGGYYYGYRPGYRYYRYYPYHRWHRRYWYRYYY
jgi:hypothetical protein